MTLDADKLPADPDGDTITFDGSSGNDAYRLSLTGDTLLVDFKTGNGNDKITLTGRENPGTGTTTISVEDAASTDRFDISVFSALSLDAFGGEADEIGNYYCKLESQSGVSTMAIWYASDGGGGTVNLNNAITISSTMPMSDAMFLV